MEDQGNVIREKGQIIKVCYNFKSSGTCRFGDNCKYSHDLEAKARPDDGGAKSHPPKFRSRECRFFQQLGKCRDGGNCKYSHTSLNKKVEETNDGKANVTEIGVQTDIPDKDIEPMTVAKSNNKACSFFFSERGCIKGDKCGFSHLLHDKRSNGRNDAAPATKSSTLCQSYGFVICNKGEKCKFRHGMIAEYGAILCPEEENGRNCRYRGTCSPCMYDHKKCRYFFHRGYCLEPSCTLEHLIPDNTTCSECGTNFKFNTLHWKPLPKCFHVKDSPVPAEKRIGGLSANGKAYKCCGCIDVKYAKDTTCDSHHYRLGCYCPGSPREYPDPFRFDFSRFNA